MLICHDIDRFDAALRSTSGNSQGTGARNVLTLETQKVEFSDNGVFGQAVAVYGDRSGDVRNIGSAREASAWLLYEWPDGSRDSLKARAARQACAEALDGGDAEDARLAFRLAVEEAGNLIGDVDRIYMMGNERSAPASRSHRVLQSNHTCTSSEWHAHSINGKQSIILGIPRAD
jgi:hypothetical protein